MAICLRAVEFFGKFAVTRLRNLASLNPDRAMSNYRYIAQMPPNLSMLANIVVTGFSMEISPSLGWCSRILPDHCETNHRMVVVCATDNRELGRYS